MALKQADYTPDEYVAAFRHIDVAPHHMRMLLAHYHAPSRTLTASQMAKVLGYPTYSTANLHYGTLGRIVAERLAWVPLPDQTVFALATFAKPRREWQWIMRPAVAEALERLGWVDDHHSGIADEVTVTTPLYEGAVRKITVNAYERNSTAREMCILHYGCRCFVCGLALAEKYGDIAQGMIHVHHLRQLAEINAEYRIDPVADLRPVCPTCHAVIHSRMPPIGVEELRNKIAETKRVTKQRPDVTTELADAHSTSRHADA